MLKLDNIFSSYQRISKFIVNTPLYFSERLSNRYNANIYFKKRRPPNYTFL